MAENPYGCAAPVFKFKEVECAGTYRQTSIILSILGVEQTRVNKSPPWKSIYIHFKVLSTLICNSQSNLYFPAKIRNSHW